MFESSQSLNEAATNKFKMEQNRKQRSRHNNKLRVQRNRLQKIEIENLTEITHRTIADEVQINSHDEINNSCEIVEENSNVENLANAESVTFEENSAAQISVTNENDTNLLQKWAISSNISHEKLSELLVILRRQAYPNLPKSAKTFLKTQTVCSNLTKLNGGSEFVYFGVATNLQRIISTDFHIDKKIELLFNVNGIPLFKSSSKQFWPILCKVHHASLNYKPFIVAIYCGSKKPDDISAYLDLFIKEMNQLQRDRFILRGQIYEICIKAFICDRPARSLLKCIKNHGGYFACERCVVQGRRIDGRTIYPQVDCELRDHQSFINQDNPEHHTGFSPLLELHNIDMIQMFTLDFMHLCCLGVMKKLFVDIWLNNKSVNKFSFSQKSMLSRILLSIKSQIPCEFQRTTRDLSDIQKWKATEFRFFLLYAAPIVLKPCLIKRQYKHFLLLHVACRILCSNLALSCNAEAKQFLTQFVQDAKEIFGQVNIVLNMHSLIHLADDAKFLNGPISDFTAFPFESALGHLKKLLRNGNHPLSQVCRRLHKRYMCTEQTPKLNSKIEILKSVYSKPLRTVIIKKIKFKNMFHIALNSADNAVMLKNGKIMQVKRMQKIVGSRNIKIIGVELKKIKPIFSHPIQSNLLQMWKTKKLNKQQTFNINMINKKILALQITNDNIFYTMPLLHVRVYH